MKAILSDIHANLEALQAVLEDVWHRQVDRIYNLGDTIGHGPNPVECIDLAMKMDVVLLGHTDHTVMFDPFYSPESADEDVVWTRRVLVSSADQQRHIAFLSSLQASHNEVTGPLYVHGSPRSHLTEYVFPEDIFNARKMGRIGERFDRLCFAGHTHVPGIFVEDGREQWRFLRPDDCGRTFPLDGRKVLCNVGSVGQPRDGDWRACYVTFNGTAIQFHRVEYDRDATSTKLRGRS
jgi:diadenosine tetraphosphatase ApaH/serine/threonine PP2A family protein phosphatase